MIEGNHGGIETRCHWIRQEIPWLQQAKDWSGLKSIDKATGEKTVERRCFISSLSAKAKPLAEAISRTPSLRA